MRLLISLVLAGQSRFHLVLEVSALGLTVSLAISEAESIGRKVAIGLLGWS